MDTRICNAIKARAVLTLWYDGGMRTVEPHCHGFSTAGNEVVRVFQSGGFSNSGAPTAWKLLDVGKIRNLQQTTATFPNNRPGYNANDSAMRSVHCHV